MKISNNWIKDYITTGLSTEKISEYLTDIGLEVEGVHRYESIPGGLKGIVVGRVLTCEQHPNADKLKKTTVDISTATPLDIVCGAPNVAAGQLVAVATVGTDIYAKDGSFFTIKEAKIRGEKSQGMLCSESELGFSDDHSGIMVLDETYKVGEPLSQYHSVTSDEVYEIGLTPNRTDAMSHYGVARDLHAFMTANGGESTFKKVENTDISGEGSHGFRIEVEEPVLIPRYVGAVISGVKVEESPAWLAARLEAIGLKPLNNIVDVTNYILHSLGQPLHAFDADKIAGKTVRVGVVPAGTAITTLDGQERKLSGSEIIIKDGEGRPLCLGGVFGGQNSGVSAETKTVFLESAYFQPVAIRKAAKQHGLNTDASFRFERGIDPLITRTALTEAIKLISEVSGGRLQGDILEFYPEAFKSAEVVLKFKNLKRILGIEIAEPEVLTILKALEIEVLEQDAQSLRLLVPPYRADVTREIDVIEEIIRIYGFNRVQPPRKISFTPVKLDHNDRDALENWLARALQSNGFSEVMNNSLRALKNEEGAVKLLNPLSSDLAFMRTNLLEGLLDNAAYNINRKSPDLKFFELGNVYHYDGRYTETRQLALLITGREVPENWLVPKSAADFFTLKGYVKMLLARLGQPLAETPLEDPRFRDGLSFGHAGVTVARMGAVSADYLRSSDVSQSCFYAEIDLDAAYHVSRNSDIKFREIPKFNKIRRDLALLLDQSVTYADLYKAVMKRSLPYLKAVNLFDVYEGKNLPEGKKSYALSFELLNEQKTLEEKEITAVMDKLIKLFTQEFGAQLR